ncbi:NADH dehydrogenase [ubiquinone] 1 beta subcomplex subunit 9 ASCRUDRAFT_36735 [Ascoidea rubescens DSM 1968]|uniref:NADH dehydrogenase [ubiquinone] 1 beta subcomplex subunit 9 n=1 Tax=Ascoidea rubescens DSM 1968 TaxID=1344418 RepID=A0A1D2VDT6_9ASCO|nr:hypothetical protein ASCRUDRAFT_36735 [Ascoidea rubescens DSM 1968]ODV59868.1 hypothetical protein ASCRUDRAFT_36735 [Ascoidea rubescens DSM 1968]
MSSAPLPLPFTAANRKLVCSYYLQSLRLARNWIFRRDLYRKQCMELRRKFDINKDVSDPKELNKIIRETQGLLYELRHPDPIIPPGRPGGTKYERVVPPKLDTPYPSDV